MSSRRISGVDLGRDEVRRRPVHCVMANITEWSGTSARLRS